MDESGYLAVAIQRSHSLFEAANHQHAAVHLEKVSVREGDLG
jgi:hypothetical protein